MLQGGRAARVLFPFWPLGSMSGCYEERVSLQGVQSWPHTACVQGWFRHPGSSGEQTGARLQGAPG